MFLVGLVLNEVFLIVCCNTPNQPKKAIHVMNNYDRLNSIIPKYYIILTLWKVYAQQ